MNWQHTIANIAIGMQMKMLAKDVNILVIYRPPLSSTNSSMNYFMEEFSSLLEQYDIKSGSLLIAGDFNLHIDRIRAVSTANFINLLVAFNLRPRVTQATHRAGHILDLIITRCDDERFVHSVDVDVHDSLISDHFTIIMCNLDIGKLRFERKAISYRNLKSVAIYAFRDCIERSPLLTVSLEDISRSVALYHSERSRILDCYAPPSTRVVTIRPAAPWYSNEINIEKRQRLKRRWRKSRLPSDRLRFTQQCRLVNRLLWSSRTE